MGKCPACGVEVASEDFYCHQCGKPLRLCPNCGFQLPREVAVQARYCPSCGQPLQRLIPGLKATLIVWLLSLLLSAALGATLTENLLLATVLSEAALAVPPLLYLLRQGTLVRSLSFPRRPSIMDFLFGLIVSPASFAVDAAVNYPVALAFPPPQEYLDAMESLAPRSILDLATWFVVILVFVGPCEEFLSRWFVQRGLERRFSRRTGLVFASALFGLAHLSPWSSIGVTAAGLLIGYVYQRRSYNLWAPIGVHVGHDWLAFAVLFISPRG